MKPFAGIINQSNLKHALLLVAIPFLFLAVGIAWIVQDSPSTAFTQYQKALSTSHWEAVLVASDENTTSYLDNLRHWIGEDADGYHLDAFEQFLVQETRYVLRNKAVAELSQAELLGIWMKALEVRHEMVKVKMVNQYYFGEAAVGQLFNTRTRSNTGKKIRFMHESGWKVDTMGLMEAFYAASAYGLSDPFLIETHTAHSDHAYLSRHPQALNTRLPERHAL